MDPINAETLARWAEGKLLSGSPSSTATTLCTDSRALKAGDLFLALRGETFDGHAFIPQAAQTGAMGVIAEEVPAGLPSDFVVIVVADTLRALQSIAAQYRRTLDLEVVAITGSNGKTSTKDFTAAVLGERFKVTKTAGNFNNHIGLPLTMLAAQATHEAGVFEIGMNHPGEIAPLAAMAMPDVAIITNVGIAHIEFMGSREAIAQEKGMLAEAVDTGGHVILCAEDDFSEAIAARTKAKVLLCGIEKGAVRATDVRHDFSGTSFTLHAEGREVEVTLPVPGVHMVRNALLAIGAGLVLGLTPEQCVAGLSHLKLSKGRLEQKLIRGIHFLDDTYNANPDSMAAALRTLAQMPTSGRRIAVLGRMGELGSQSEAGHQSVGEVAAQLGIDVVIGVGAEPALTVEAAGRGGVGRAIKTATIKEGIEALRGVAEPGDIVLVKGSRSSRMERIVEGLQAL
ncbi:MAG: UDP-N-acetylmuramoyl-tripeptide--D-alanyl-D-alanine ligase [Verrucomicrobiota bacterium]